MQARGRGSGAYAWNGKARARGKSYSRRAPPGKLVREMWGGEPYEFYPLGKYVVAAPNMLRGRPTFKYTRIEVTDALTLLAAGWTTERIEKEWWGGRVTAEAIQEAVKLAAKTWLESSAVAGWEQ